MKRTTRTNRLGRSLKRTSGLWAYDWLLFGLRYPVSTSGSTWHAKQVPRHPSFPNWKFRAGVPCSERLLGLRCLLISLDGLLFLLSRGYTCSREYFLPVFSSAFVS